MALPTMLERFRRRRPSATEVEVRTDATVIDVEVIEVRTRPVPSRRCHDHAKRLIHKYVAFATAWALLPIPMATSAGLALLETHLIYWIARIYGEEPKKTDVLMTAAGLELASVGLKTIAMEGAALLPGVGLGVKAGIAGSVVLGVGRAILSHYEEKYPGKQITA
jgi:uncharacterized protein (DUF697 family)